MATSVSQSVVDAAPGNLVTIPGTNLYGGQFAGVTLDSQGVNAPPALSPTTIALPATFAVDGSSVTIGPIPDGVMDGTLTITAGDTTTATCALRARSQYVQASEYSAAGEGLNVSAIATTGELDAVLRRASAYADAYMNHSVRLLQTIERHKYRPPRNDNPPRILPWRSRGRHCPIVSVDQLSFISAQDLVTDFNTTDLYVNSNLGYIEVLAYAVGNYALLGALEVIGYSANIFQLAFTSGFPYASYPGPLTEAVTMIATDLLVRRNVMSYGLGGLKSLENNSLVRDLTPFDISVPAKRLLMPFVSRSAA